MKPIIDDSRADDDTAPQSLFVDQRLHMPAADRAPVGRPRDISEPAQDNSKFKSRRSWLVS